MGLRTWTVVTGAASNNSLVKGGFRWQVTNSDEDRIENNRSILRVEAMGYTTGSTGTFNLSDKTSSYEVDGSTQNYTSRVDFRTANTGTYYYVDGGTSIFPKGDYKDYTISHDEDGTKSVDFNMLIAIPDTSAAPGITFGSDQTIELPDIARGVIRVNVSGTWKQGLVYVNVGGTWKQATGVYTKVGSTWEQSI